MAITHKSAVYKDKKASNPFLEGQGKAYGEILKHVTNESTIWRRLSIAHILLFVFALILFFAAVSQQKTVPVLINVMPSGEAQYLGEVRQNGSIQVSEASIHFQIRTFVTNIRSVSTDYMIVYNLVDDLFFMVTHDYEPIMKRMLLDNSPFDLVGKIRRLVEIESVLAITEHSYAVNWTESVTELSSPNPKRTKYRAVITIQLINPTKKTITRNPLGIYIENFEMTEL